jgi:hypothetical protein
MSKALSTFLGANDLANVDPSTASQALMDDAGDASLPADGEFINFSGKLGVYAVGRERSALDLDHHYVVNSLSLGRGWCCWKKGKPVGRHRWSAYRAADAIDEGDLEDHGPYNTKAGDGWKDERMFAVKGLDDNLQGTFTTTSVSGCNSVADLQVKIGKQMAALEPFFPVILFGMAQFEAQGQTNYKPTFEVVSWVAQEDLVLFEDGKMDLEQLLNGEIKPKVKKVTKKKAPAKKGSRRATL